jgi:hypothetical protein
LQALFRSCRGPVTDFSKELASISGIMCAATLIYGRAVVAAIDAKLAHRIDDSAGHHYDDCEPLLERVRCKIAGMVPENCNIVLVCQDSSLKADCVFAERAIALFGVPMASVAVAFETLYLCDEDEYFDYDNVVSREDMEEECSMRTERAEAAIAIREIVSRPEVINNIKKWLWRPSGRLVSNMVARDTVA